MIAPIFAVLNAEVVSLSIPMFALQTSTLNLPAGKGRDDR